MSGREGMDYAALYPLLDRHFSDPDEWERVFGEVRLMESEALKVMRSK